MHTQVSRYLTIVSMIKNRATNFNLQKYNNLSVVFYILNMYIYIYLLAIFHIKSVYQVRFDYLFIELAAVIECEVRDLNPRSLPIP